MPAEDAGRVALQPRDVHFGWDGVPLRWIPGEPLAAHAMNVLHLLLPEGERFFVRVLGQALPLIQDEQLRADVVGFIGQEAVHAGAHQQAQDHLRVSGLDARGFVREMERLFRVLLDDRGLTGRAEHQWLLERLAIIAAIEHVTAFLGDWVLHAHELDAAHADATMLDLLRWHGAEEVEHRAVVFDLYEHLDGGYLRRARTFVLAGAVLWWLFVRGTRHLMAHDPTPPRRARWGDFGRAVRRGLLPSPVWVAASMARYLRPGYHPLQDGSTDAAVAYLARSPAARAADA